MKGGRVELRGERTELGGEGRAEREELRGEGQN